MKQGLQPRDPVKGEAYNYDYALPRGLLEAVDKFEGHSELENAIGQEFCKVFAALKRHEAESFLAVISPWEREHLLLNV